MRRILQNGSRVRAHIPQVALSKGLACGAVGGLAATMVMDLVLMVVFSALGLPALTCFTIVGNTAARMFSLQALQTSGSAPLGAAVHYLVGPLIGAIFGALVSQNQALRVRTFKKGILLAVLYVEILSQPILATTPILLNYTTQETIQWFAGSFGMHFIWGVVLGAIVSIGLRPADAGSGDYSLLRNEKDFGW